MTNIQAVLPVDATGNNPTNLITSEYQLITGGAKSVIRPDWGSFYKDSLQIYSVNGTNQLAALTYGADYVFAELDARATEYTGKIVYQAILITNPLLTSTFSLTYQAYGGESNQNKSLIYYGASNSIYNGGVSYSGLTNVPSVFQPAAHTHDIADVYGMEWLTAWISRLSSATGNFLAGNKNLDIQAKLNTFSSAAASSNALLASAINSHISNTSYQHSYTPAMIGLGNVSNYGFTPLTIGGVAQPYYATPATILYNINNPPAQNTASMNAHKANTSNPHATTAANVGLNNLSNYFIQTTYTAGQYATLFMDWSSPIYLGPYAAASASSEYYSAMISYAFAGKSFPGFLRNRLKYTQDYTQGGAWAQDGCSVIANASIAPDGTNTMAKVVEGTGQNAGAGHKVFQIIPVTEKTTYTLSFYAKAAERTVASSWSWGSETSDVTSAFFNLVTGVATGSGSPSMVSVGNGIWRCSRTAISTPGQTALSVAHGPMDNSGIQVYIGDGTSGAYFWGTQLELGTTTTDYQRVDASYSPATPPTTSPLTATITQSNTTSASAVTASGNITTTLNGISSAQTTITSNVNSMTAVLNRYNVVNNNIGYASMLTEISQYDYAQHAIGASVSSDGYWSVPDQLSDLYLWLSANNPQNTIFADVSGALRVTTLLDKSPYARMFSGAASSSPIYTPSSDIVQGKTGITQARVLTFNNGANLMQTHGVPVKLTPGMSIFAVYKTPPAGDVFSLLTSQTTGNGITVFGNTNNALVNITGTNWAAMHSPDNTILPNTSTILGAVIAADSEANSWCVANSMLAGVGHPRGVNTPAGAWPGAGYVGDTLNLLGNTNYAVANVGEFAELIIYNRALSGAEAKAVLEYLRLRYNHSTALAVDYSSLNAF